MNELVINLIAVVASVVVAYLLFFIETKRKEISAKTDNELYQKYIDQIASTISAVVARTNQTYVDELKKEGSFDIAAQEKALHETYNAIYDLLTDESKKYLEMITNDIPLYLMTQIEAEVKIQKTI